MTHILLDLVLWYSFANLFAYTLVLDKCSEINKSTLLQAFITQSSRFRGEKMGEPLNDCNKNFLDSFSLIQMSFIAYQNR